MFEFVKPGVVDLPIPTLHNLSGASYRHFNKPNYFSQTGNIVTKMKELVVVTVVLFTTVIYGEVARFPRLGPCKDITGKEYPLNVEFDNVHDTYCESCTCFEFNNVCVSNTKIPLNIHESCEAIFRKETCDYRVVTRDDPDTDCPFEYQFAGVVN
ncbi:beta-microseminoprotein-like [Anneissia japonica]|uniref:beta-microseminoprotein-like n=1 Tax=Anneissia japonica TaxID=1529436 RepID=UPI0014257A22|nr:beta-microseminoprotein-like [Anneissia japonica]